MTEKGPKLRIGLDIGGNSIKFIARAEKKRTDGSRLALVDLVTEEIVQHPGDVDEIQLTKAIREVMKDIPYKQASVRVCFSETINNLFVLTIPQVANSELKQTLFWELGPLLPQPVNQYEFDYRHLHHDHKKKQITVLVGVVSKDKYDRFLRIFKSLGTSMDMLETDTLSALSLFMKDVGELKEPVAFLQLGANHANYVILAPGSDPSFLFIPFGGNSLSDTIAHELGLSFSAAEKLRREYTGEKTPGGSGESSPYPENCLAPVLEEFGSVISQFNIRHQFQTGKNITRIYVTGGLLNDRWVAQALSGSQDLFRVPCEFWDPLSRYFSEEQIEPRHRYHYASALGLSLR